MDFSCLNEVVNLAATRTTHAISTLFRDHVRHKEARRTSIMVATVISEILKTMLGPKGMSKMLVTATGDVVITSEGKTTLEKLNVTHPIARILIDVAKTQYTTAGDGTKTAVILAAELLKEAGKLLGQNIHPTVIIRGYEEAIKKTLEILERLSKPVSIEDDEVLKNVVRTVMGSRIAMDLQNHLAEIVVIAARRVAEEDLGKIVVNVDNVDLTKKGGGSLNDSKLMNGVIIYKGRPHPRMPWRVENAKIALLNCSLEPFARKNVDWRKEYLIKMPEQLKEFIVEEKEFNRGIVENVKRVGARVLFCCKRISESILSCFAREGIIALDMTGKKDMVRLEKATGGKIVSNINELSEKDLGEAGLVEFRKISGDEMLFIDRCKNPKATSILIRGGTEQAMEELERIIKASLKAVAVTIECGKIIAGGGATEMEVAGELREFSRTFKGREQLAIEAFASAMEAIPKTLATNAGLDPINVLMELRARHNNGFTNLGVNALKREVEDVMEKGLVEVYKVKKHALIAAGETANAILRIDDFINVAKQRESGEEERLAVERKRIMDEKIRKLLEKEEELKQIDKSLMERMMHPETI